jgi:hypothetical protein
VEWACEGTRRGANPVVEEPALTWLVSVEGTAGSCSDVRRRCWRQLCCFPWRMSRAGGQRCAVVKCLLLSSYDQKVFRSRRGHQNGGRYRWAADTSPTSLIVPLWILHSTLLSPVTALDTKESGSTERGKLLIRDWPSLVTSSNCRYCPAWRNSFGGVGARVGAQGRTAMWAFPHKINITKHNFDIHMTHLTVRNYSRSD